MIQPVHFIQIHHLSPRQLTVILRHLRLRVNAVAIRALVRPHHMDALKGGLRTRLRYGGQIQHPHERRTVPLQRFHLENNIGTQARLTRTAPQPVGGEMVRNTRPQAAIFRIQAARGETLSVGAVQQDVRHKVRPGGVQEAPVRAEDGAGVKFWEGGEDLAPGLALEDVAPGGE